ncbi:MAG: S53 family peptidase [Solirubrobacteraceae bacterium]
MTAALAGPVGSALGATVAVGGASASLLRARVIGPAPSRQTVHMTVTLRPRDLTALIGYAHAVSTPGTAVYGHYLTPAQFAARFGAAPARATLVRRWLRSRGLTPGRLSAGALSIPVTATAGRLQHALGISLARLALPGDRRAMAARAAPVVSKAVAGAVQALVGLDTVARRPLSERRASGGPLPRAARHVATGGPQACPSARTAAAAQSAYTADQIASAYGFAGPYGAGNRGAGITVAMYELEPVAASDLAAYESCYGLHTDLEYAQVDGGAGSGGGSGEAALDIENFISLAPASRVIVYAGPNSNSGNPGSGPYDTFASIINQDRAQVVSVSWGECEAALGATDAQAENTLFAQAAIQGQTIVAAAGDSGSADCNTGTGLPQTQLAVDDPASQPLVTGVGGTTLSTLGLRPVESVWNDAGKVTGAVLQPGAGGGGISNFWAMPAAQRTAASSLGVLSAGPTGSACGASSGYCRQVPDVAMNANPATGYLIYWNGNHADPGQPAGWQVIGGTSGGAPVWAALFALADSSPGCTRSSLGDALPALYRAAAGAYGANFNDVQTGNNDFSGTNGGRYPARPGYDEASGLGTPNAASLVAGLCANALRLQNPGDQTAAAHATVALSLRSADVAGASVKLTAHGLPPGLLLAAGSGLISGVPRRHGRYRVQLTAQDGGSVISRRFVWTIGTPAIVRGSSITGVTGRAPVLSVTVAAGAGSPPLSTVAMSLPPSLLLSSTRGIAVSSGSFPVRFRARRTGRSLLLTLRHATRVVTVLAGPRGLAVAAGRQPRSVRGASLGVVLTDSSGGISSVSIRPRVS